MIDALLAKKRIKGILDLLGEERKTILNGPLSNLNILVEKREKLLDSLLDVKTHLSEADMELIRNEAVNNKRLLAASLSGVREAQKILSDQYYEATTMGTYMSNGKRMEIRKGRDLSDRMV